MQQDHRDTSSERNVYRMSVVVSVILAVLLLFATIALLRANM